MGVGRVCDLIMESRRDVFGSIFIFIRLQEKLAKPRTRDASSEVWGVCAKKHFDSISQSTHSPFTSKSIFNPYPWRDDKPLHHNSCRIPNLETSAHALIDVIDLSENGQQARTILIKCWWKSLN